MQSVPSRPNQSTEYRNELLKLITSVNTNKQPVEIKRTPKFRFRAVVRTVINNLKWLTAEDVTEENLFSKPPKLFIRTKALLRTPPEERSKEEKDKLSRLLGQLEYFDRYPENVRCGLAEVVMFAYFPPGRVLIAEGQPSMAMYFFISGQAKVTKMVYDSGVGKFVPNDVGEMKTGFAFGEMNNLHDELWSMTVTTITHVEVLEIFKEDFQRILEKFLGNQRREITHCLNQFFYFKDWDHRTIVECCILAKIVHYKKDEIILGDNCESYDNSYFIISGSCRVIYHLKILHIPRKHHTELRIFNSSMTDAFPASYFFRNLDMPKRRKIQDPPIAGLIVDVLLTKLIDRLPLVEPKTSNTEKKPIVQYVQNHFFKIVEMLPGACFGIGESLENKFILAESPSVKLLRIPRFFLKSHNSGNIWEKVIEMYKTTYPSAKAIFSQFLTDRQWNRSKTKYMESLLKAERPFTGVTNSETPFYLRLTMDFENPIFRKITKVINE